MLDYCLDIKKESYTNIYTPDGVALSLPFYLLEDGYFEANINYYTIRNDTPKYLLIYTISGCGMVKVSEKTYNLPAGYATLIDCTDLHEYRTLSYEPWCFHYLHFDGIAMKSYKKLLLDEFKVFKINDNDRFMKHINYLHNISNESNVLSNNLHSCDWISSILTMLYEASRVENIKGDIAYNSITVACDYIDKNLKSKISVVELAKLVNLSEYYFIRLFERVKGVTPYQYLQIVRINRAKELLTGTKKSINEIAKCVGFSSCTRFSRSFLDITGTTPSLYRKNTYSFLPNE